MKLHHKIAITLCMPLFAIAVPVAMLDHYLTQNAGPKPVELWKSAATCLQDDWQCWLELELTLKERS